MRSLLFLFALLLCAYGQSSSCGAPQCYYPCTDARPVVDIVFLIDVSGSMAPKIQTVAGGLSSFISGLNGKQINPAFAVVLFGDQYNPDGTLTLALTTSTTAITTYMTKLGNSQISGGIEPGLEAMNQAMNTANTANLNIAFRNTANSKKVFILVTNEDADMADSYTANLWSPQNWNSYSNDYYCYNIVTGFPSGYKSLNSVWNQGWQNEVNSVFTNMKNLNANLYMFVAGQKSLANGGVSFKQTCNTIYQYCNPDIQVQNSDYTGFDATATYNNIVSNSSQNSLQAQLIKAGKVARCFDVQDTVSSNSATLINNFFTQITADLSACDTTCYNYSCITSTTCAPPVAKCDCKGIPFTSGGNNVLDKNGVCCPQTSIDLNNVCCTGTLNQCGVCSVNPGGSYVCKADCAGTYYLSSQTPPHHTDECGNCVPAATTRASTCVMDCAGTWYSNYNSPPHVYDNCSTCVTAGTDLYAQRDACFVCNGKNASMNQCGVCFGTTALDACGYPVCKNNPCNKECDGQSRQTPTLHVDVCGNCIPLNQTKLASCVQDCAGNWYNQTSNPPYHLDPCGNCIPYAQTKLASCVQDCAGVWSGTAFTDKCNQCVVNNSPAYPCLADCNGTYYLSGKNQPVHAYDNCSICNTVGGAAWNSLKDVCGVCTNTPGYNTTAECTPDCKGVYSLITNPNRAFLDACNDCWLSTQKDMTNYYMDACGLCFASRSDPGWNAESLYKDTQGVSCKCFNQPVQCPGGNATTCNDHCPPACPNGNFDGCGRCPGDKYYGLGTDECGQCATANSTWNAAKDSCGVCFGNEKGRLTNPCKVCDAKLCHVDCLNKANGTAVYDACGVCGGDNSTCVICADGTLGPCKSTTQDATGAIAGGIIGAIAGVIVLGLAAFFALQYAKKNGLLGNANKNLDMAASNSNPLYKSEVKVQHNALYGLS